MATQTKSARELPQRNVDGSLTLTSDQVDDLHDAFRDMFETLFDMPTSFGDFFYDDRADYPQEAEARIHFWDAILDGNDPADELEGWELHYNGVGYFDPDDE